VNGALLCKDNSTMNPKLNCGGDKDKDKITTTAVKSSPTKDILPTRRSSRVIKTPAWLEEDSITPLKRRRK
jgi:hypothetical protein